MIIEFLITITLIISFFNLIAFLINTFIFNKKEHRDAMNLIRIIDSLIVQDTKKLTEVCDHVVEEFPFYKSIIEGLKLYHYVNSVLCKKPPFHICEDLSDIQMLGVAFIDIYNKNPNNKTRKMILAVLSFRVKILSVINYPSVNSDIKLEALRLLSKTPDTYSSLINYFYELNEICKKLGLRNDHFSRKYHKGYDPKIHKDRRVLSR